MNAPDRWVAFPLSIARDSLLSLCRSRSVRERTCEEERLHGRSLQGVGWNKNPRVQGRVCWSAGLGDIVLFPSLLPYTLTFHSLERMRKFHSFTPGVRTEAVQGRRDSGPNPKSPRCTFLKFFFLFFSLPFSQRQTARRPYRLSRKARDFSLSLSLSLLSPRIFLSRWRTRILVTITFQSWLDPSLDTRTIR